MTRTVADRIEARRRAYAFLHSTILIGAIVAAFVLGAASMLEAI